MNISNILRREEVYFTGKENIEGYACLMNVFMNSLKNSSDNPVLINVDNDEHFDENHMQEGQLFYESTIRFKDTFTCLIAK